MTSQWSVVVGNVGTVYDGPGAGQAARHFRDYCKISESGAGRAGGETVTLLCDGEPLNEYDPPCPACHGEGEIYQDGGRSVGWYLCYLQCGAPVNEAKRRHRVSVSELARQQSPVWRNPDSLPAFRSALNHLIRHGAWSHTVRGRQLCADAIRAVRRHCSETKARWAIAHMRQICGSLPFRPRDRLWDRMPYDARAKEIFPAAELERISRHEKATRNSISDRQSYLMFKSGQKKRQAS